MTEELTGIKVAIVSADGFEQSELFEPKKALEQAGATVQVISLKAGEIKGWNEKDWGKSIKVDAVIDDVNPEDFDALMLPGGVLNPDKLRQEEKVVEFVTAFMESGKPVAAICHGPQTLIETGLLEGRKMTSYAAIKTDLVNAGANWVDEEVVVDQGLVTSRKPADLPAFNRKMIEEFAEGVHNRAIKSRESADQPRNVH
jgi:protease I